MSGWDWYIVQVRAGSEDRMSRRIRIACEEAEYPYTHVPLPGAAGVYDPSAYTPATLAPNPFLEPPALPIVKECFSPQFRTQKKLRGEWIDIEHPLMPGYLVAVTKDPWRLQSVLYKLQDFARVVSVGGKGTSTAKTYVPLNRAERQWVESCTKEGDRVVPMSMAYKEGDRIVVTSGPLVGQEGKIVRVKRSASLAFLEFHVGNVRIKTTVGLGIVTKKPGGQG